MYSYSSRRQTLSLTVQNELQKLLMQGAFLVGESLPSEQALSERYKVSRTTVRDAISGLVEKGFLERRHGKGVYVIDKSEFVVADSLRIFMMRGNYTVAEFMETREAIEEQIAYFAAQRATDEQIEKMRQLIHSMLLESENIEQYALYDLLFHKELAKASQNRLLNAVITAIEPLLTQVIQKVVLAGGQVEKDSHYHENILNAVLSRDSNEAREKMRQHLSASKWIFKESSKDCSSIDKILLEK
jgi:GntR family transcriptional repressor for pyruvate dehydrogenase complex